MLSNFFLYTLCFTIISLFIWLFQYIKTAKPKKAGKIQLLADGEVLQTFDIKTDDNHETVSNKQKTKNKKQRQKEAKQNKQKDGEGIW